MDKLIKYLKEELKLSDEIIKVVLANIKVKYVVPTYYFEDIVFTDLNVLNDPEDKEFYNIDEFNIDEFSTIIYKIITNKAKHLIPKRGIFNDLKVGNEYWAIYKNASPVKVVVQSIEEKSSWAWYTYNYILFKDITNNKEISFWDEDKDDEELFLFSTREEAVKFYKDKNDLN
jgi:hypothetical protein